MPSYNVNLTSWATVGTGPAWMPPQSAAEYIDGTGTGVNPTFTNDVTQFLTGTAPTSISSGSNEILTSIVATCAREASLSQGSDHVIDNTLVLVVGGSRTSLNKASGVSWPLTFTSITYTWSASDLASLGVTLATVQQSNFGIALSASRTTVNGIACNVDGIVLTLETSYVAVTGGNLVLPPFGLR